jgi:hypothetical protein
MIQSPLTAYHRLVSIMNFGPATHSTEDWAETGVYYGRHR